MCGRALLLLSNGRWLYDTIGCAHWLHVGHSQTSSPCVAFAQSHCAHDCVLSSATENHCRDNNSNQLHAQTEHLVLKQWTRKENVFNQKAKERGAGASTQLQCPKNLQLVRCVRLAGFSFVQFLSHGPLRVPACHSTWGDAGGKCTSRRFPLHFTKIHGDGGKVESLSYNTSFSSKPRPLAVIRNRRLNSVVVAKF